LLSALRILRDVAVYRLEKREMANLAASLTVMAALRLGLQDVAWRLAFGLLLNLSVYLANDWYDVEIDLAAPHKDHDKARFLSEHRGAVWGAQLVLVCGMAAIAVVHSLDLWVPLVVGAGLCWAYSAKLKRLPVADVATISICGVAGALVAVPLESRAGWALAGLLGLYAACFQTIQMVRDHDADAAFGVRTTAVHFGVRRAILLLRVLLACCALYSVALLHLWIGLALLLAPLMPARPEQADRAWNVARLWLGLVWLALVAAVWWTGSTAGLLVAVAIR
jgi:4-hydroxybenzoate polyprenyltransferase